LPVSDIPTTAVPPPPAPASGRVTRPRTQQFAIFLAALAWYFCAQVLAVSASNGLAVRFDLVDARPLLEAVFLVFLIVLGFAMLRAIERRRMPLRMTLGLPRRATSGAEWATGAAIGWGIALISILPLALARTLNVRLWTTTRAFELLALNLATLAVLTLAEVLVFTGYPFQRLIEALGPTRATIFTMLIIGIGKALAGSPSSDIVWVPILFSITGTLLLSIAWIRTHGLWLPWGLNFAWNVSVAALFGLPIRGSLAFSSVVESRVVAPLWLGGFFGPELSAITPLLILAAIPILVFATSDYAWSYTRPPLIPAGYDVTIAPPAAHVAMEQSAQQSQPVNPASLVQILPVTPRTPPE
jgi:uncharacterized protein